MNFFAGFIFGTIAGIIVTTFIIASQMSFPVQ